MFGPRVICGKSDILIFLSFKRFSPEFAQQNREFCTNTAENPQHVCICKWRYISTTYGRNLLKGILIEILMQKRGQKNEKHVSCFDVFPPNLFLNMQRNIFWKHNTKQCALINCVWVKRAVGWENCV